MPTYEYRCKKCKHEFEEFQKMSDDVLKTCPKCKTKNLIRIIGSGGPLVFKGSGYYLTDYKKTNTSAPDSSTTKGNSSSKESSESKGEAKSDTKTESKQESKKPASQTASEKSQAK